MLLAPKALLQNSRIIPISSSVLPGYPGARGPDLLRVSEVLPQPWGAPAPPQPARRWAVPAAGGRVLRSQWGHRLRRGQRRSVQGGCPSAERAFRIPVCCWSVHRAQMVLLDIRNTVYQVIDTPECFLIISAHLETEVAKINRMMQTSDDGNKSIGREVWCVSL